MTKEHKNFLDNLRNSGKINMFCSVPYIQEEFVLKDRDAREILIEWMESFEKKNE